MLMQSRCRERQSEGTEVASESSPAPHQSVIGASSVQGGGLSVAQQEFGTLLSNSDVSQIQSTGKNTPEYRSFTVQGFLEFLFDFLFCLCYANGWGGILDVKTQADEKTGF